jgi:hypothetical protein
MIYNDEDVASFLEIMVRAALSRTGKPIRVGSSRFNCVTLDMMAALDAIVKKRLTTRGA